MPEFFVEALSKLDADTDKNGKTSLWKRLSTRRWSHL